MDFLCTSKHVFLTLTNREKLSHQGYLNVKHDLTEKFATFLDFWKRNQNYSNSSCLILKFSLIVLYKYNILYVKKLSIAWNFFDHHSHFYSVSPYRYLQMVDPHRIKKSLVILFRPISRPPVPPWNFTHYLRSNFFLGFTLYAPFFVLCPVYF